MSDKNDFGPGFQSSTSKLFRAEYALISLVIVAYLVYNYRSGISLPDILALIFFGALPDLAAFIPIGAASSKEKNTWPQWGASLYNLFHTILLWALVFALFWFVLRSPYAPLLGWLLHITADRSAGYSLRDTAPLMIKSESN